MVIGFRRRSWLSHRTRAVGMIFGRLLSHLNSVRTILLSVGVPTTRARECQLSVQTARRSDGAPVSVVACPPVLVCSLRDASLRSRSHAKASSYMGERPATLAVFETEGRKVRESAAIRLCLTRGCASLGWDIHHISQAALSQEADLEPLRVIWLD